MRYKPDFHSIKFRVWLYFLLFAVVLFLLIWFLQTYFLNNYYKDMKVSLSRETATAMINDYEKGDVQTFIHRAIEITNDNDIYIRVDKDNETIFPSNTKLIYDDEIKSASKSLTRVASTDFRLPYTEIMTENTTDKQKYIFASYLNSKKTATMYVVTPLYPVTSTVKILQNQLVYIIIISLFLAFGLSLYLSTKISTPISNIITSSRRLADGEYGIEFPTKATYSEISNLSKTLNKTSKELAKSVELQKDLMANVSHDLRTPLTMIKSYAEMIRDLSWANDAKREKHLQVIISESDRLSTLVSDMLALSAVQSGTVDLKMSTFNMKKMISSVLQPYRTILEEDGYTITLSCRESIFVFGDEGKMKQVIYNLITNAAKYGGTNKYITVNVRVWGSNVHCEVSDRGVGIEPDELPHIWDRYYKASSHYVRKAAGSGLGLSIVKEILNMHNSKYGAESKVNRGTTIWFQLPLVKLTSEGDVKTSKKTRKINLMNMKKPRKDQE